MKNLDEREISIIREIIKNPKISDNQISINTKIPTKTVNRKRKHLERENLLYYFAYLNTWKDGVNLFNTRKLYIIKFREGITRNQFLENFFIEKGIINIKHTASMYLGETNGLLALIMLMEAKEKEELMEIFNADLIPKIKTIFGEDAIKEIVSLEITDTLQHLHNYIPRLNITNGIIKNDWPDNLIFVT